MRELTFGIDLDKTITADPGLFKEIIALMRRNGHRVLIVTARSGGKYCDILEDFEPLVDGVVFADGAAKEDIVDVDIWIDDFPFAIVNSFDLEEGFVPGRKAKERYEDRELVERKRRKILECA